MRHGGNVYAAAKTWGLKPNQVLDFSANLNPLGPPAGVQTALKEQLALIRHYPEPHAAAVRKTLAERWHLPEANLAIGNGAAELIYLVARLARRKKALILEPAFAEYRRAVLAAGGEPISWPLKRAAGFRPDLEALALADADLIFLTNPHNPTGVLLSPTEILTLADSFLGWLVIDEAFIDLSLGGQSVIQAVAQRSNLIVLRSLTKRYALPGLRLGAVAAPADLIRFWDRTRDPWSVTSLSQVAASVALNDPAFEAATDAWLQQENPWLQQALAQHITVLPSPTNFILARSPKPVHQLQAKLKGILLRDCRSFQGLDAYDLRVAVRTRAENQRLIDSLKGALQDA